MNILPRLKDRLIILQDKLVRSVNYFGDFIPRRRELVYDAEVRIDERRLVHQRKMVDSLTRYSEALG